VVPDYRCAEEKRQLGLLAGKYPPMDFEAFQAMDAEIESHVPRDETSEASS